ncbi:MAG: carbon monoxide dehydrogenase accessory protein CooC [Candidatus Aerophobetes bacterium]|nr:carbon monoxide dehydrogenase accessory protein CooC [Candidatus Aerophobetes bacterium]
MKIAVTGKGGVGKTTLVAGLIKYFTGKGRSIFAIDADPDTNLAPTLSFPNPSQITPLIQMKKLIEERTGAKPGSRSPYFKLNPKVDDIPDKYFIEYDGIKLAVMGTVRGGGMGCTCPENAFLKALLSHLLVEREEVVILDMEAGIEHLGRGTARAVDELIVVVEPGKKSIETAFRIRDLALQIRIPKISVVANKIRGEKDRNYLISSLSDFNFLGFLSFDEVILEADINGFSLWERGKRFREEIEVIVKNLTQEKDYG